MTSTDIEDSTEPLTLLSHPDHGRHTSRGHGTVRLLVVAAVVLTAFVVAGALVPVPYVNLQPGSVRPVSEQVLVEGAPSYPPTQSIGYTTVRLGEARLLEAVLGWLDDDVDVLPKERVQGGRSAAENRRYNAQLMDSSKLVAITVALEHLGYTVPIRTTGTVVRQIVPGSPADGRLKLDDVIVDVDGAPVDRPGAIGTLLQPGGPGATHTLTVERPAGTVTTTEVRITTTAAPDDPSRAVIGIAPEDRIVGFDLPIKVSIDSGDVGGPSAGLAFTLAVLDLLTPGELTGSRRVAVTGTMSLDGTVGPVGGAAQKAIAVRDAGYQAFLVPSQELAEVQAVVGDDLRVIGVDTLDEALDALESLGGNARSLRATDQAGGP